MENRPAEPAARIDIASHQFEIGAERPLRRLSSRMVAVARTNPEMRGGQKSHGFVCWEQFAPEPSARSVRQSLTGKRGLIPDPNDESR
jgi:hypothetical protein